MHRNAYLPDPTSRVIEVIVPGRVLDLGVDRAISRVGEVDLGTVDALVVDLERVPAGTRQVPGPPHRVSLTVIMFADWDGPLDPLQAVTVVARAATATALTTLAGRCFVRMAIRGCRRGTIGRK